MNNLIKMSDNHYIRIDLNSDVNLYDYVFYK
jgi:hypothetical protein